MRVEDYNFPDDLKYMTIEEMQALSGCIREFLIDKVSKTGGHLASNLGVVELTLALHKVFDSPKDKIVWDVGHQAYVHKILTGRADRFDTLRKFEGLSGFPKRSESEHDTFDAGHSSNSISAAYGMAKARDLNGEDHAVIAVIGDGALTGGVAFEALNNAGHPGEDGKKTNLLVILNDNEMSIGKNIGSITQYLNNLRSTPTYNNLKRSIKKKLNSVPVLGKGIYRILESIRDTIKFAIISGGLFEGLGFKYLGPVEGNSLEEMITILEGAKNVDGPVLIHIITKKGKGYLPAEKDPDLFHGIAPFAKETNKIPGAPSYSKVFGDTIVRLAKEDEQIVAISAAMVDSVGLKEFKEKYPNRLFDVAIAEQHAVDFAAGLATCGFRPFIAIYSTFLQRAYDQILIDICMQNLPVTFCLDRAGSVGDDGETHHGIYDVSYLSHMPNMTVMAPKDGNELSKMLEYSVSIKGPVAIRYPRGAAEDFSDIDQGTPINGSIEIIMEGSDSICILSLGKMVSNAYKAAKLLEKHEISVTLANARFVKPIDAKGILSLAAHHKNMIVIEDNTIIGGFGSEVNRIFADAGIKDITVRQIGWPDQVIKQGSIEQLERRHGLAPEAIAEQVLQIGKRNIM